MGTTFFHRGEPQPTEAPSSSPPVNFGDRFLHDAHFRNVILIVAAVVLLFLAILVIAVLICVLRRRKPKARADVECGLEDQSGFRSIPLYWIKGPGATQVPSSRPRKLQKPNTRL
ncbi:uncharacterized protein BDZ99DRAFT_518653 [Mytilinidion resinicola]|uniref:Uncharacterized protein n=1 Tax=Mytilinidion resinicola TaxID=574789 RepID=A0A6A6YTM8_9PEZI|nr:uncharacterized protein BDZ99DRAFT_518653 [Mytilinidion resinicola]KAF2811374.1 hypothetical protein BDZ99DRAFT_518653 [Mytilinidion resinicola]